MRSVVTAQKDANRRGIAELRCRACKHQKYDLEKKKLGEDIPSKAGDGRGVKI